MQNPRRDNSQKDKVYDNNSHGFGWLLYGWVHDERAKESGRMYKVYFLTLKNNTTPLLPYACDMFYIHIILSLKNFTCIVHLMLYKLIQIPKEKLNNNQDN